jgi:hypothetical protein
MATLNTTTVAAELDAVAATGVDMLSFVRHGDAPDPPRAAVRVRMSAG